MDNFIARVTERFSGQDVITANAEAEAVEMRKLKSQNEHMRNSMTQYDLCLKEMRKLSVCNEENAKSVRELIDTARSVMDSLSEAIGDATATGDADAEAAKTLPEIAEEMKKDIYEAIHRENVKVYRNVQALLLDEMSKHKEEMYEMHRRQKRGTVAIIILLALTLLAGLGNLGMALILSNWFSLISG